MSEADRAASGSRPSAPVQETSRRARRLRRGRLLALTLVVGLLAAACDWVHGPFLSRVDQPVVMTGADIPSTLGLPTSRIIGFRYDHNASAWTQIPIQIDERVVVDFGTQPSNNNQAGVVGTVYGNGTSGVTALQYADPNTFVGPDTNPAFDADDELVFLARDAGQRVPNSFPTPASAAGAGVEVTLTDVGGGTPGYVYLFPSKPGVDQSAGKDYVDYDFSLLSGDYKTTYRRASGPNPEQSTVVAEAYRAGMVDRWKTVEWTPTSGSGVDILDGYKSRFSFSTCGRSNETFANGEGAFVANIDGPVRAIRSLVGANSGPLTQETITFYPGRIEYGVDLRVHSIGGVLSFIDFASSANGMLYSNSQLAKPRRIDGSQDIVSRAVPSWQYAHGPQGYVTWAGELDTSVANPSVELQWRDQDPATVPVCWGDDNAFYGAAASAITSGIPNTDPRSTPFEMLRSRQVVAFWPTGLDPATWTPNWAANALEPLDVGVGALP